MRKYILRSSILGVAAALVVLSGCASGSKDTAANNNTESIQSAGNRTTQNTSGMVAEVTESTTAGSEQQTEKNVGSTTESATETTAGSTVEAIDTTSGTTEEVKADSSAEAVQEASLEEQNAQPSDAGGEAAEQTGSFAGDLAAASSYSQLVVVESSGTSATVTMHQIIDGVWTEILRTDGHVGSLGVGQANEFQSITPEGTFPLYFAFGVNPNPGTALSYLQVDENDYWVGDSSSPLYNQYVRTDEPYTEWDDAEHLIDYPAAYAYCLFIGYNVEGTPGAGSCFFLHCSDGRPTAGCVSVSESDMIFILNHIGSNCGIVIQ